MMIQNNIIVFVIACIQKHRRLYVFDMYNDLYVWMICIELQSLLTTHDKSNLDLSIKSNLNKSN